MYKNFVSVFLILICSAASISAYGENHRPDFAFGLKSIGVTVFPKDRTSEIQGKYFLSNNSAIVAALGYNRTSQWVSNSKIPAYSFSQHQSTISLSGGYQRYFVVNRLSVYWEGLLSGTYVDHHNSFTVAAPAGASTGGHDVGGALSAYVGVEYFLARHFSVGARVGLSWNYNESHTSAGTTKHIGLSTLNTPLTLNAYW